MEFFEMMANRFWKAHFFCVFFRDDVCNFQRLSKDLLLSLLL